MDRAILVVFVTLLVVLAGCAGGTEGAEDAIDDSQSVGDALDVVELNVADVSPDEEYIVLENTADEPVDLSGFELRDREDGQVDGGLSPFSFPSGFILESGETVRITTGEGDSTETELYWGYNVNIWRDDGDVVRVADANGQVVLEHAYGDINLDESESDGDVDGGTGDESDGDGESAVEGELEIHHIDVGQGDSTLIITPANETILIDTGDWRQDGSEVIAYLEAQGIDRIDHLVATHADADHIGGHAAVIEHFETTGEGVGAVYDSGVPSDSATYENYLDTVDEYGVDLLIVESGDELPLEGDVSAQVMNPPAGDAGSDVNDNSVVLAFEFGDFQYLAPGDVDTGVEQRLVDEWGSDLESDIYKAGHHGSSTSSSDAFVDAIGPETAIISSAYDSQYGHPSDEVLERFADREIKTYWTGVHGDIVVRTDGTSVDVESRESFSTDPEDILAETPDSDDETNALAPPQLTAGSVASGIDGAVAPAMG
ncbi:beta-lactamase [Natrinema pellirubrum DSM 15624]|uniref:Beta-lactamase n=1 Tax=Natrinema pellirubrum (strain DSM 15624 / CIP 106293 / JCM 10476 / NCIMB 786 / 157) TaxID=797303 RepID=L0JRF1_NATP1|nr:putative hydrolase (metallo-beta-lactamase superfamily) [Natrinema pellirubrum DSM 15624]ELY76116.1 beta-lactamase [Natrinema pellirubrum DSM 15624]